MLSTERFMVTVMVVRVLRFGVEKKERGRARN
jgi:hypothetical protein